MALDRQSLIELAKATAKASVNPSLTFSFGEEKLSASALESTFRKELVELSATPALYRENKNLIFNLIEISSLVFFVCFNSSIFWYTNNYTKEYS